MPSFPEPVDYADRFDFPVGTEQERAKAAQEDAYLPGEWWIAQGYDQGYPIEMKRGDFHTGIDLNLSAFRDDHQSVYACANGEVVAAGRYPAWGNLVVVRHNLRGTPVQAVWSRYAHLENIVVKVGDDVLLGQAIAQIGDYGSHGPRGDHLHFDIASINLGRFPTDWPNRNRARLRRDYRNPVLFIQTRRSRIS